MKGVSGLAPGAPLGAVSQPGVRRPEGHMTPKGPNAEPAREELRKSQAWASGALPAPGCFQSDPSQLVQGSALLKPRGQRKRCCLKCPMESFRILTFTPAKGRFPALCPGATLPTAEQPQASGAGVSGGVPHLEALISPSVSARRGQAPSAVGWAFQLFFPTHSNVELSA